MSTALVLAAATGVAATWLGILLAYDSYYWGTGHQGLPVSFIVAAYLLTDLAARRMRTAGRPGQAAARRAAPPATRLPSPESRPAPGPREGAPMFTGSMINTWVIATIVAPVAGVVGFFVVLRGSAQQ